MSTINWEDLSRIEEDKFAKLDEATQFRVLAMKLLEAPYSWGGESLIGADCSGTVCFPLYLLGYNIRETADFLFNEVFTSAAGSEYDPRFIEAIFYVKGNDHAVHVTPIVGPDVVLHAGDPVGLRTSSALVPWFRVNKEAMAVTRRINKQALREISESGDHAWDVDQILKTISPGVSQ